MLNWTYGNYHDQWSFIAITMIIYCKHKIRRLRAMKWKAYVRKYTYWVSKCDCIKLYSAKSSSKHNSHGLHQPLTYLYHHLDIIRLLLVKQYLLSLCGLIYPSLEITQSLVRLILSIILSIKCTRNCVNILLDQSNACTWPTEVLCFFGGWWNSRMAQRLNNISSTTVWKRKRALASKSISQLCRAWSKYLYLQNRWLFIYSFIYLSICLSVHLWTAKPQGLMGWNLEDICKITWW